jgi:hypothetical protein
MPQSCARKSKAIAATVRHGLLILLAVLVELVAANLARAQDSGLPQLQTIDAITDEVTRTHTLDIKDEMAVLEFVLGQLPSRVKVYPTENYFYFRFIHNGLQYAGNLRLDAADRDKGKIQFGYYEELAPWKPEGTGVERYELLDAARGVRVERLDPFAYRVTYKTKSVIFELNDLSRVKPPAKALGPDEKFLGPVFDESAVRFFLIFNAKLKVFHFVLDETEKVHEEFFSLPGAGRILVGKRTGFAFYRDHKLDRKILIGAYALNSLLNNYYDGPFDQLPDNFIKGEQLREAIIASDPSAKGKIGRLGHFADGESRYGIHPYMLYKHTRELLRVDVCARGHVKTAAYYRCFVAPERLTHSDF